MAALPIAIVPALAAAYAPQIALETVLAFAQDESGLDPPAIHDNIASRAYSPRSLNRPIRLAYKLMQDGDDLTLLAINQRNLSRLALTVAAAFDQALSTRVGAHLIVESA